MHTRNARNHFSKADVSHQIDAIGCRAMRSNEADNDTPLPKIDNRVPCSKKQYLPPSSFLLQADARANTNSHSIEVYCLPWYVRQDIFSSEVFSKAALMQQIINGFRSQGNQRKVANNLIFLFQQIIHIRVFLKPGYTPFKRNGIHAAEYSISKCHSLRHIVYGCFHKLCRRGRPSYLLTERPGFPFDPQFIYFLLRVDFLLSPRRCHRVQVSGIYLVLQPAVGHSEQFTRFFGCVVFLVHVSKSLQRFVLSYPITASYAIYMIFDLFSLDSPPLFGYNLCKLTYITYVNCIKYMK